MTLELLFKICNAAVLPAWILLAVKPRWKWSHTITYAFVFPLLMAAVYSYLIAANMSPGPEGGGFGSLGAVAILFQNKALLLAGWIHYLCFDLFVGSWEVRDAARNGIPHWLVIPCLFFTLMFGPFGLLLYMIIRFVKTRRMVTEEFPL